MDKLFIIGNGFDISHGMKTKYSDFRDFLIEYYDAEPSTNISPLPERIMHPNGGEYYDKKELSSFLVSLIDILTYEDNPRWGNLEERLGEIDYYHWFEFTDYFDKDGELNSLKTYNNNESMAYDLKALEEVKSFFNEWVNTFDYENLPIKENFKNFYSPSDLFLTFNYTSVLEILYNVNHKNICYIHGNRFNEIHFGHNNSLKTEDDFFRNLPGSEKYLSEIDKFLQKNTEYCYKINQTFFNEIEKRKIMNFYSYGFSFSDVDSYYFRVISKFTGLNSVWYINNYSFDEIGEKTIYKIIENFGFINPIIKRWNIEVN